MNALDPIHVSILENEGPEEVYYRHGSNTWSAPGPLTPEQRAWLVARELRRHSGGEAFHSPEFDADVQRQRAEAKANGTPWHIDSHPEEYTKEARLRRYGLIT